MSERGHVVIDSTDPYERGLQRGRQVAAAVAETWPTYLRLFEVTSDAYGLPHVDPRPVAEACLDATASWSPALVRELEGVASGAGISLLDVMVLNARTEILSYAAGAAGGTPRRPAIAAATECSAVVELAGPEGAALSVQTWDWHDELSHGWHTQEVRGDAHDFVGLCEYGMLAKIGMNDAGLGLHFNLLRHASEDGAIHAVVPVHLVARRVLAEATTPDEAEDIARSAPIGASTVLTVVTPDDARSIELSPAGVGVVWPSEGWLVHTNHFVDPALAHGEAVDTTVSTTFERYDLIRTRGTASAAPLEHAQLAAVLHAHEEDGAEVCRHPDLTAPLGYRTATLATVLLDPAAREANVRDRGPRDGGAVRALRADRAAAADSGTEHA